MLPNKASDNPWQEVRRGKQKNVAPLKAASEGRGLQNSQPPLRVAANGRSLPKAQPTLQAAPKKEDIPYEIKNAREWDPNRKKTDYSSESSDYEEDEDDSDFDHEDAPHHSGDFNSTTRDGISKPRFDQRNPIPPSKPPTHPKIHRHGKRPGPHRVPRRAMFNFKRDNLARAAFRKRLEPSGKFILPKDCPEIEPDQKKMYDIFDEMGVRLRSFIRPPQHPKDRELLLWGDLRQIQDTKAELQRWLNIRLGTNVPRSSMAKNNFARELSSIGDQYHRLMKKMQKEAKILDFQQAPAAGRVFPYTGTFLWPVDEVRPEDILGPSLEAFDPIRFQYQCHIIFDNKFEAFRIFSEREENIKKTMNRMVGTMREYVAKNVRPGMIILIEPPTPSAVRKSVKVLPLSSNGSKTGQLMVPSLTGNTLDPQARHEWLDKSKQLVIRNDGRIELSLRKCITNLPHYRGLVRIRVQFGTFALKTFRWSPPGADSIPFEEFIDNMTMPGTKGVMIRE